MSRPSQPSSRWPAPSEHLPFYMPVDLALDEVVTSIPLPDRPAPEVPRPARGKGAAPSRRRRPVVTVDAPGKASRRLEVQGNRFVIGRRRGDLALDDPFVSDWHAQLFELDGALTLEDMGSRNGIFLRIADELVLEDHDEIVVGLQRLVFRTGWDEAREERNGDPLVLGAPVGSALPRLVEYAEGGEVVGVHVVGDALRIGREAGDIVRPYDEMLSSPHAAIERRGNQYYLRDLRSQSGTFIRVRGSIELIDGDCFLVGRTRARINYP